MACIFGTKRSKLISLIAQGRLVNFVLSHTTYYCKTAFLKMSKASNTPCRWNIDSAPFTRTIHNSFWYLIMPSTLKSPNKYNSFNFPQDCIPKTEMLKSKAEIAYYFVKSDTVKRLPVSNQQNS